MPYRTIHTKPNGVKYVYEATSYWDKDKKAPRNRQVCLGKLDEITGEVIPSKKDEKSTGSLAADMPASVTSLIVGPSTLLNRVAQDTGLSKILSICFPDKHTQILSLAYFLVQKGLPLSRCEIWSTSHKHPSVNELTSQRVSELLHEITESERQTFFSLWMDYLAESECFYYDLTSVSSYSEQNEYVRFGHNRDKEKLPQINIAMLYGQRSALPGYYRRLPGNISDVSTLQTTVQSLSFIGQTKLTFILDRGFYSETNVDALLKARFRFILACPKRTWIEKLFETYHDVIVSSKNRRAMSEHEVLYMHTIIYKWKERRCYVHIYYNNVRAADDLDSFMLKLATWQDELVTGNENIDNEWAYKKYFIIKNSPKRGRKVIENAQAVENAKKKHVGFFCLLTPYKTDALTAIETYRRKEAVENCFDDLKNMLDMKRLRIHSSQSMDSRIFIQFIALIILSQVRLIKNQHRRLRNLTIREIMELMETIAEIRIPNKRKPVITEIGPLQRDIVEQFGLSLKT